MSGKPAGAVRVRVPATSANLGPGFDTFGLALGLYDEVSVEVTGTALVVDVEGEGAQDVPRDESHLVVSSLLRALRTWGSEPPGLRVRCRNTVPHGRGLGSSAAAIVAGLAAARALLSGAGTGTAVTDDEVLALATRVEGHPDNVAAALAGGFTLAWACGEETRSVSLRPHACVEPVVCVPGSAMSTTTARGLLPEQVPHGDAVVNAGRAGLLVAALTSLPERLLEATEDRLHQPFRAPAMPATADLLARLRERGVPAVLSGAGPTVLALCDSRTTSAAEVTGVAEAAGGGWSIRSPGVDLRGATVAPLPTGA